MKVHEAVTLLQSIADQDSTLCIPCIKPIPTIGPSSVVDVKGFSEGFDWDSGTTRIHTNKENILVSFTPEEYKEFNEYRKSKIYKKS